MDENTNKKTGPLIGFGSRGFCLLSGDPNNNPRRSHLFVGIGGTSVISTKNDYIEYQEQREYSRGSLNPSSSKSILQNSSPISPKLGSSNSLNSKKTCPGKQSPITLGKWNSTQISFAGFAQL